MIFIFSSGACYKFAAGQQIPALQTCNGQLHREPLCWCPFLQVNTRGYKSRFIRQMVLNCHLLVCQLAQNVFLSHCFFCAWFHCCYCISFVVSCIWVQIKGIVHPKMKILSLITHPQSFQTRKTSFIFRTQIKIFLMNSESSLTLL